MRYEEASEEMKIVKEQLTANISHENRRAAYTYLAKHYNEFVIGAHGTVAFKETADRLLANLPAGPARLLDVGCGTGVLARYMHTAHETRAANLDFVGCDYTPAMLAQAKRTGLYSALHEADINAPFTLGQAGAQEGLFDAMAVSGVFVEGHCVAPVALVNILAHLRPGGVACVSVRTADLGALGDEYVRFFDKGGCDIVSCEVGLYRHAVPEIPQPEIHGFFVIAKKRG